MCDRRGPRGRDPGACTWIRMPRPDKSSEPTPLCGAAQLNRYASLRSRVRRLATLCIIAAAGGCASTYVAPTAGAPAATLSFQVSGNPTLGYAAYLLKRESSTDHRCVRKPEKLAQIAVGMPLLKTRNPERIGIPANDALYLRAMYVPAHIFEQTGCSFDLSFTPVSGKAYRIQIDWTRTSCVVGVSFESNGSWLPMQVDTLQSAC